MSKNNPLRGEVPLDVRPTLIPGPLAEGQVTHAEEPIPVTVELAWTDGHTEAGRGWAKAWTPDFVLVDVQTSRGHYYTGVFPEQVTRRPITRSDGASGL